MEFSESVIMTIMEMKITRYFIDESNFIVDINSYNNGLSSTEYIQSVTECEVIILN